MGTCSMRLFMSPPIDASTSSAVDISGREPHSSRKRESGRHTAHDRWKSALFRVLWYRKCDSEPTSAARPDRRDWSTRGGAFVAG
jgi:hypothetical protein